MEQAVTNFRVYEDSKDFLGVAQVTLPDLNALTQTMSGAGLAGNVEVPIRGHYEPMTMSMNFLNTNKQNISLSAPKMHNIDLRANQQIFDQVSGTIKSVKEKHLLSIMPKSRKGGTLAPASPTNPSGDYVVYRWLTYIDGKLVQNIDPINYKCIINGVDYLKAERTNLGM